MSRLEELIQEHCPDGVEYRPLWAVTIWDKKFNSVDRAKQPRVITYPYLLASDLFALEQENGDVFLLSTGEQTGWTTEELAGDNLCEGEVVTIPWGKSRPVAEVIKYYKGKFVTADNRIATSTDVNILLNKYLYYWLLTQGKVIDGLYRGSGLKHPSMKDVLELRIPIPPMPVQQEIVRILDSFAELTAKLTDELNAELSARQKQYEYYRDLLLTFKETGGGYRLVKWLTLEEVFLIRNGYTPSKREPSYWEDGTIPWYRLEDIRANGHVLFEAIQHVSTEAVKRSGIFPENSILLSTTATIGEFALIKCAGIANQQLTCLTIREELRGCVLIEFAYYYCYKIAEWCKANVNASGNLLIINKEKLRKAPFPIPPLAEQARIVAILDRFDALCNDLSSGLPAEIEARRRQYEYYRDKLLNFKELGA